MAIHLIQRSQAFTACKAAAATNDCIVLLGEGVAAILQGADQCFVSDTDVRQRGLSAKLPNTVTLISDSDLVRLCTEHSPVVSWSQS